MPIRRKSGIPSVLVACASLGVTMACAVKSGVSLPAVPTVDTVFVTRVDTIQTVAPPPAAGGRGGGRGGGLGDPEVARYTRMIAALERDLDARREAYTEVQAVAARNAGYFAAERRVAASLRDSLADARSDSARVDGYREMVEGKPYTFTLSLGRNMVLPQKVVQGQETLVNQRIPALSDSARVCLTGDGFRIVSTQPGDNTVCRVQLLAARAQRQWTWTVTPDSIDRANYQDPVDRQLVFAVTTFTNGPEAAPDIVFPVKVWVRARPFWTQVSDFLKTTTGIVTLLASLLTALGSLWGAMKLGERKGKSTRGGGLKPVSRAA